MLYDMRVRATLATAACATSPGIRFPVGGYINVPPRTVWTLVAFCLGSWIPRLGSLVLDASELDRWRIRGHVRTRPPIST